MWIIQTHIPFQVIQLDVKGVGYAWIWGCWNWNPSDMNVMSEKRVDLNEWWLRVDISAMTFDPTKYQLLIQLIRLHRMLNDTDPKGSQIYQCYTTSRAW